MQQMPHFLPGAAQTRAWQPGPDWGKGSDLGATLGVGMGVGNGQWAMAARHSRRRRLPSAADVAQAYDHLRLNSYWGQSGQGGLALADDDDNGCNPFPLFGAS